MKLARKILFFILTGLGQSAILRGMARSKKILFGLKEACRDFGSCLYSTGFFLLIISRSVITEKVLSADVGSEKNSMQFLPTKVHPRIDIAKVRIKGCHFAHNRL